VLKFMMPLVRGSVTVASYSIGRMLRALLIAAQSFALVIPSALTQTAAPPAAQEPAPNSEVFGEEVMLTGKPIVFISGKATWDKAYPTLVERFKSLAEFLAKQKIAPAGLSMTIYTSVYNTGFDFQAAVPLSEAPVSLPRGLATAGQSPVGKALKFVYRGSYESMDSLYESITNYLDEKRIERQGLFFEEYVTDPSTTPEDKLVVNVYVLVK